MLGYAHATTTGPGGRNAMTEATTTRNGTAPEPATPGEHARAWLRDEWAAGRNPSGAAVAREFGLGERTGQLIVAEAKGNGTPPAKAKPKRTRAPKPQPEPAGAQAATTATPAREQPEPEPTPEPEPQRAAGERTSPRVTRWDLAALGLVALVAAVLSFAHQWHLAQLAGEGALAWLLPFSVDGMVAVASRTMLARRRSNRPAKLATAALVAGVFASVAANIAGADHTPEAWAVAAWPPLAYLVAYELLLQQLHPNGGEDK